MEEPLQAALTVYISSKHYHNGGRNCWFPKDYGLIGETVMHRFDFNNVTWPSGSNIGA